MKERQIGRQGGVQRSRERLGDPRKEGKRERGPRGKVARVGDKLIVDVRHAPFPRPTDRQTSGPNDTLTPINCPRLLILFLDWN